MNLNKNIGEFGIQLSVAASGGMVSTWSIFVNKFELGQIL